MIISFSLCVCVGLPLMFARFSAVIFISIVSGDVLTSSVKLSTAGTVRLCQVTCDVIELQHSEWRERQKKETHTYTHTVWTGAERQPSHSLLIIFSRMDPAYSWVGLWRMEGFLHFSFSFLTLFSFMKSKLLDKLDTASQLFLLPSSFSPLSHYLPFSSSFSFAFPSPEAWALIPLFPFSLSSSPISRLFVFLFIKYLKHCATSCSQQMQQCIMGILYQLMFGHYSGALWDILSAWQSTKPPVLGVHSVVSRVGIIGV